MPEERWRSLSLLSSVFDTVIPALLVAAIIFVTAAETAMRTVFGSSVAWYSEVIMLMFSWAVFLAGVAGIRTGRAIAVDAIYFYCSPRIQYAMRVFSHVLTVGVGLTWAYFLWLLTARQGSLTTVVLDIPFAARTTGIVIAFVLIAILALRNLLADRVAESPEKLTIEDIEGRSD